MSDKTNLEGAMTGIQPYTPGEGESFFEFKNVSTQNFEPPAYMVAFVFFNALGYRNYGEMIEKVWWHTYFTYKGCTFLVRDYKFGTWSLESKGDIAITKALVPEVMGKIRCASRYADRLLEKELRNQIDRGHFFINNGYGKLRRAYEFYLDEATSAMKAIDEFDASAATKKPAFHEIADHHNRRLHLENVLAFRAVPLMTSFFSLLEFLLDVFYAFQQPDMTFFEFRNKPWRDRLKEVVPVSLGSPFASVYGRISDFKGRYRDPLTHGLTNESSLLVAFPFAGLIPVSYEHLSNAVHFGFTQVMREAIAEMTSAFEGFLALLSEQEPYCYYILYVDYGFSVPMAKEVAASIRKEMTSYEGFEEWLQAKSMYQDAVTNREI